MEADALFRQEKLSIIKRKDKFFHLTSFDKFHIAGYKGLYNGETAADIAKRKLKKRQNIR